MVKIKEKKKEEMREIADAIRKTLKEREQLTEILKEWGPDLRPRSPLQIQAPEGCKIYLGPTTTTTTMLVSGGCVTGARFVLFKCVCSKRYKSNEGNIVQWSNYLEFLFFNSSILGIIQRFVAKASWPSYCKLLTILKKITIGLLSFNSMMLHEYLKAGFFQIKNEFLAGRGEKSNQNTQAAKTFLCNSISNSSSSGMQQYQQRQYPAAAAASAATN